MVRNDSIINSKKEKVINVSDIVRAQYASLTRSGRRADPFEARRLFLLYFLRDTEMREHFIASFSVYAQVNFSRFNSLHKVIYAPEGKDCIPGMEIINRGLNIIYNDALEGSLMARNGLIDYYKKYYKKEYNQLKRYKVIKLDEIKGIAEGLDASIASLCRIACIAELMDIELDRSIDFLYLTCEEVAKHESYPLAKEQTMLYPQLSDDVDEELYKHCYTIASQYDFGRFLSKMKKMGLFYNSCLNYSDYPNLDSRVYSVPDANLFRMLVDVIYILEATKQSYTDEDLYQYLMLRIISFDSVNRLNDTFDSMDAVLGLTLRDEHFKIADQMRESQQNLSHRQRAVETDNNLVTKDDSSSKTKDELEAQIRELQIKIHEKDQAVAHMHDLYEKEKKERLGQAILADKVEAYELELIALRNYAHKYAKESQDISADTSESEMLEALSKCRYAIVGGHPSWINKMKAKLPEYKYFSSDVRSSISRDALTGVQKIYFFTNYIGHAEYNKFVSMAKSCDVNIGFLNEVNIDNAISYLYRDI